MRASARAKASSIAVVLRCCFGLPAIRPRIYRSKTKAISRSLADRVTGISSQPWTGEYLAGDLPRSTIHPCTGRRAYPCTGTTNHTPRSTVWQHFGSNTFQEGCGTNKNSPLRQAQEAIPYSAATAEAVPTTGSVHGFSPYLLCRRIRPAGSNDGHEATSYSAGL